MDNGYIKLFRELFTKPIWLNSSPEQKTVLIALIGMVNHEGAQWEWKGQKFEVKPGQTITSIDSIRAACGKGVSTQNVRSALKRFEKLQFLTNESTKTGRLITIENWTLYQVHDGQPNKATNKEVTKSQQRGNKEVTSNKNNKNDKNDNNPPKSPQGGRGGRTTRRRGPQNNEFLRMLEEGVFENE